MVPLQTVRISATGSYLATLCSEMLFPWSLQIPGTPGLTGAYWDRGRPSLSHGRVTQLETGRSSHGGPLYLLFSPGPCQEGWAENRGQEEDATTGEPVSRACSHRSSHGKLCGTCYRRLDTGVRREGRGEGRGLGQPGSETY